MGSRPSPFGSRDHSTHGGPFPTGGPLWPCIYPSPLWRYGASNVGRTHARTDGRSVAFVLCPDNKKHNKSHKVSHLTMTRNKK